MLTLLKVSILTSKTVTSKASQIHLSGLQLNAWRLVELDLSRVCRRRGKQALKAWQVEVQTRLQPSNRLVALF